MAINSIQETWEGRGGDFNINQEHTVTRAFVAVTDGKIGDTPSLVADSLLLPTFGSLEPSGLTLARLKRKRVVQDSKDKAVFRITCEYDTKTEEEENDDPTLRPLKVSGSFVSYTKEVDVDNEGKHIVNRVNDPLIVEQEDNRLVLVVVRPVLIVDVNLLADYRNAINSDSFGFVDKNQAYQFEPKQTRLATAPFRPVTDAGVAFYEITYSFDIEVDGWNPRKIRNEGLRYHDSNHVTAEFPTGVRRNVGDATGQVSNVPVLLDDTGNLLGADEEVIFIESNTYEERPFARLFT